MDICGQHTQKKSAARFLGPSCDSLLPCVGLVFALRGKFSRLSVSPGDGSSIDADGVLIFFIFGVCVLCALER